MDLAQTFTIIGTTAALLGLQALWIGRSLDALGQRVGGVEHRMDRLEDALGGLQREVHTAQGALLREHGERLVRLETLAEERSP